MLFHESYYLDDLHGQDSEWHNDPPRSQSKARYSCPLNVISVISLPSIDTVTLSDLLTDESTLQLTNANTTPNANANFFMALII